MRQGAAWLACLLVTLAGSAASDTLRLATFNTGLSARGPGLLLRDTLEGKSPPIAAVVAMIAEAAPDVLVLQDIDYDLGGATLAALADRIARSGPDYAYRFALRPNSGMATPFDLDGDGRRGGPRDRQGYGDFAGAGGMAVLSRYPIDTDAVVDLSDLLWRDLPGAIPPALPESVAGIQRLSSVAHWIVPVRLAGGALTLLTWHATPPVFDGVEDRNGRRNRDETALWLRLLDGELDVPAHAKRFVVIGVGNVDPVDGEGIRDSLGALLADPRLQDPAPRSEGAAAAADPGHEGDAALDTADYGDPPGNLRVSYILPSADLKVTGSGVLWPAAGSAAAARLGRSEDWPQHRLVWIDLELAGDEAP